MMQRTSETPRLGIGVAGLGRAARLMLPAIHAHPRVRLAAVADIDAEVREEFARSHGIRACSDVEQLAAMPEVDVVYLATPTPLHASQTEIVASHGKHVVVEKPMAIDLAEAERMTAAAARAGVILLVGHSHSFDIPVRAMRKLIEDGALGRLRMLQSWCYTDWIYRPRRPDELDPALGGSVVMRQGAHQFDVLRLLAGGKAIGVRADVFDWDPVRPTAGAFSARLAFADGTVACAVYNGYGAFDTSEFCFGIGELGHPQSPEAIGRHRRAFHDRQAADEIRAKRQRADAGEPAEPPFQPFFGMTIASCENGDIRQSPRGLYLYDADGRREIALRTDKGPRTLVLDELCNAVLDQVPALHDGAWGLANLEVSVAVLESARTGVEVPLVRQVGVPRRLLAGLAEWT